MAVILSESDESPSAAGSPDDLGPWLRSVTKAVAELNSGRISSQDLSKLISDGIAVFKDNPRYRNDPMLLKLYIVYLDSFEDFESIAREMEESKLCPGDSFFFELYALYLESKGKLHEACTVYKIGISRNAGPLARLKKAQEAFLNRMTSIIESAAHLETAAKLKECGKDMINPWSTSTMKDLLEKLHPRFTKYEGYISSAKPYSGKVALSSLRTSPRNKIIEIGQSMLSIRDTARKS